MGKAIDERGRFIAKCFNTPAHKLTMAIALNATNMTLAVNGLSVSYHEITNCFNNKTKKSNLECIIIDATTLGVAEILIVMKWLHTAPKCEKVSIIYTEPEDYPPKIELPSIFGSHQFNLSKASVGYKSLPGFTKTVSTDVKSHLVALLGFERVRLGQLLQNDEGAYIDEITPVFGVPGFKPSYDKHSAFQNIESIQNKRNKPLFASANNPYETFKLLEKIRKTVPNKVINVAPIGTKPMAIGAALFILKYRKDNVGLMYDHPINTSDRSKGVSRIHLYSIKISE